MRTLSSKQAINLMVKSNKNRKRKMVFFDDEEHLATVMKRTDELHYDNISDYIETLIQIDLKRNTIGKALDNECSRSKKRPLYEIADDLGINDKVLQNNIIMRNKR